MKHAKAMPNGDLADYIDPRCHEKNINDLSREEQFYIRDEAVARLRAPDWQPIESAPSKGPFQATWYGGKYGTEWPPERIEMMCYRNGKLFNINSGNFAGPNLPTHWQPLPPPPKT